MGLALARTPEWMRSRASKGSAAGATPRSVPERGERIPATLQRTAHSVFMYSMSAVRSASVSTSVNVWPEFDWLNIRVL